MIEAHVNLAEIFLVQGRVQNAIDHLEIAARLEPYSSNLSYLRGVAAQQSGRLDEATAYFRHAIELEPGYIEAIDRLGVVLARAGHPADAAQILRRAVVIEPASAHAHFSLALVLLQTHQDREALEQLSLASNDDPAWVEPLNELAWLRATHPDPAFRQHLFRGHFQNLILQRSRSQVRYEDVHLMP